jgi:hypothetical protein
MTLDFYPLKPVKYTSYFSVLVYLIDQSGFVRIYLLRLYFISTPLSIINSPLLPAKESKNSISERDYINEIQLLVSDIRSLRTTLAALS